MNHSNRSISTASAVPKEQRRESVTAPPKQPRLAGRLRRGQSPEVTFEDELKCASRNLDEAPGRDKKLNTEEPKPGTEPNHFYGPSRVRLPTVEPRKVACTCSCPCKATHRKINTAEIELPVVRCSRTAVSKSNETTAKPSQNEPSEDTLSKKEAREDRLVKPEPSEDKHCKEEPAELATMVNPCKIEPLLRADKHDAASSPEDVNKDHQASSESSDASPISEGNRNESPETEKLSDNESSDDNSRHPRSEKNRPERESVNQARCSVPQATCPNASTVKSIKDRDAPFDQDSYSAEPERRPSYREGTSARPDAAPRATSTFSVVSAQKQLARNDVASRNSKRHQAPSIKMPGVGEDSELRGASRSGVQKCGKKAANKQVERDVTPASSDAALAKREPVFSDRSIRSSDWLPSIDSRTMQSHVCYTRPGTGGNVSERFDVPEALIREDVETCARSTSKLALTDVSLAETEKRQKFLSEDNPFCESLRDWNDQTFSSSPVTSILSAASLTHQVGSARVRQAGNEPLVLHKELCLYPLSLTLVIAAGVMALVFFTPRTFKPPDMAEKPHATCSSLNCRRDSVYLNDLLNWKLDPCDNFYMFVCSRWRNQFPVTDGYFPISSDDDYVSFLESHVRMVLESQPFSSPAVSAPLQGVYNACVNAKLIEDSGWDGLLEFMSEVSLDGFPLTPPVRSSVSVWKTAAKLLRKTGAATFVSVSVVSHPASPENDVISIGHPETLMAISGVDINDVIRLYTSTVFASFKALRKVFIPPVHSLNVVKFATQLENFSSQFSDEDARVETLGTASALQVFLAELFDGVSATAHSGPGVDVLIQSPDFIARLVALVQETDLHTVMNFLGVRLMVQVAAFTPQSGLAEAYTTLLYGKRLQGDLRWKVCIRVTEKTLPPLFQRAALENLTAQVPVTQFTDLVDEIVQQFLSGVNATPYLDEDARSAIRNIVSKTRFETLAPTWTFNQTLVDEYARNAPPVNGRKPLQTYAALHEYSFISSLSRGNGERWARSIFSANCWYERKPRTMYIPVLLFNLTLLFDHVYNFELSRAGVRISQCLLDMLFAEGNSTDPAEQWLNNDTAARIAEAQQCFGNDNASRNVNSLRDATALRSAYSHFLRTLSPRDKAMSFQLGQNQNASASQLFFVYLLLQSCEKTSTDEAPEESITRWNVALRNQQEFLTAFTCPMNPPKHCNI